MLQTQLDNNSAELARCQNLADLSSRRSPTNNPTGPTLMVASVDHEDVLEVIRDPQKEERGTGEVGLKL